jgi:hypothetical protein
MDSLERSFAFNKHLTVMLEKRVRPLSGGTLVSAFTVPREQWYPVDRYVISHFVSTQADDLLFRVCCTFWTRQLISR